MFKGYLSRNTGWTKNYPLNVNITKHNVGNTGQWNKSNLIDYQTFEMIQFLASSICSCFTSPFVSNTIWKFLAEIFPWSTNGIEKRITQSNRTIRRGWKHSKEDLLYCSGTCKKFDGWIVDHWLLSIGKKNYFSSIKDDNEQSLWPEVLEFLFHSANSPHNALKEAALVIFE